MLSPDKTQSKHFHSFKSRQIVQSLVEVLLFMYGERVLTKHLLWGVERGRPLGMHTDRPHLSLVLEIDKSQIRCPGSIKTSHTIKIPPQWQWCSVSFHDGRWRCIFPTSNFCNSASESSSCFFDAICWISCAFTCGCIRLKRSNCECYSCVHRCRFALVNKLREWHTGG